jgi:hypothetical protein
LFSLTAGSYNTAVGFSSLGSLTDGTNNIGIGYYAGDTLGDGATANTTPDNSIYIGYLAYASQSNGQNEIVIGSNNTGHGSNTVTLGNSSITKTILRGFVTASAFTGSFRGDGSALSNIVTQIIAGTNVTISPVGGTGAVTINASGGGGGSSTGTIILTAAGGWPSLTNGCQPPQTTQTTTNQVNFYYLGFADGATTLYANWA